MERQIDREKIVKRVKRALRSKDHVSRVHFDVENKPFYRIGPGFLFLKVQRLQNGTFRVFRTAKEVAKVQPTRQKKVKK